MRTTAVTAVVALLGVACSGGGEEAATTTTTAVSETEATTTSEATTTTAAPTTTDATPTTAAPTTTAPTTTAPTTTAVTTTTGATTAPADGSPDGADPERARNALLTIDFFPEDWIETPPEDDDESEEDQQIEQRVDDCVGLGPDAAKNVLDDLEVRSPEFSSPDDTLSVGQRAALVADEQTAVQVMAELSAESVPVCLAEAFEWMFDSVMADPDQTDFPPGTELVEVTTELVDTNLPSDTAAAHLVAITLANGDEQLTLFVETWYQRFDRVLSQVQFQGIGAPFPQDGVDALTEAIDILLRGAAAQPG